MIVAGDIVGHFSTDFTGLQTRLEAPQCGCRHAVHALWPFGFGFANLVIIIVCQLQLRLHRHMEAAGRNGYQICSVKGNLVLHDPRPDSYAIGEHISAPSGPPMAEAHPQALTLDQASTDAEHFLEQLFLQVAERTSTAEARLAGHSEGSCSALPNNTLLRSKCFQVSPLL